MYKHCYVIYSFFSIIGIVDDLCTEYEKKVQIYKIELEKYLGARAVHNTRTFNNKMPKSYSMCFDNIQNTQEARYQSEERNKWKNMWAMCFLAVNRVESIHLSDDQPSINAVDMDVRTFLPKQLDIMDLKCSVSRVLKVSLIRHLPAFHHIRMPNTLYNKYEV